VHVIAARVVILGLEEIGQHVVPAPPGVAKLPREGEHATVVSYGRTLPLCVEAADQLERDHGWSCDVLDLRSILPYDWVAIRRSLMKTGRILFVNEDTEITNFGEHLLRRVVEEHFYDVLVRPRVLQGKHVPGIGLNQVYEQNTVPQLPQIKDAIMELITDQP
jgi:2-oxoisovalerate dehydrogenase E1 component beta subunit